MESQSLFSRYEKYLFYIFILFNLGLIFKFGNFPTKDGPAHLYNARIIKSILFDHNEILKNYYTFNSSIEPNWSGHFILVGLMFFFKAAVCEKILLSFYLIMLPISFRNLMHTISNGKVLLSYFIFPLSTTMLFLFGFYNFSIGLVLLFITLNFFLKYYERLTSWKYFIAFLSLQILTYFSHVVLFSALWLCILVWLIFNYYEKFQDRLTKKIELKQAFKNLTYLLATAIVPCVFFFIYFYEKMTFNQKNEYLDFTVLMKWLFQMRVKIMYVIEHEENYSMGLFLLLFSLIVIDANNRFLNFKLHYKNNIFFERKLLFNRLMAKGNLWLLISFIFLILYFVLPDSSANGGMISIRFSLLFYLFVLLSISIGNISKGIQYIIIIAIAMIQINLHAIYSNTLGTLNQTMKDCNTMAHIIKPNSVVLPLDFSGNWLQGHFANLLGADQPMVILENYECSVGYFPLHWNDAKFPMVTLGNLKTSDQNMVDWKTNNNAVRTIQADYVFVLGEIIENGDSNIVKIKTNINEFYKLISKTDRCSLFKLKGSAN